jgi:hypothetical protein
MEKVDEYYNVPDLWKGIAAQAILSTANTTLDYD